MKTKILWIGFAAVVLGIAAFYFLSSGNEHKGHEHSAIQKKGKAKYFCPMHPTYTSDKPGDCPFCHMRLIRMREDQQKPMPALPKTAEEAKTICLMHECPMEKSGQPCPMMVITGEEEEITCPACREKIEKDHAKMASMSQSPDGYVSVLISPDRQQLIGVKTEKLALRQLTKEIRTVGRVAYDPELYQAQQEYLQGVETFEKAARAPEEIRRNAERLVASSRTRLRLLGLNDALIEELKAAGKPDNSLLLSGEDGSVWLYATIYESELALVKGGQEITATAPSLPGKEFRGVVRSVDPVLDPKTRSVRVRARLENPEGLLKPEMYLNVVWKIDLGEHLAVPQEAVLISGKNNIVFVAREGGRFDPRHVKLGLQSEGYFAVLEGLTAGETIVTNGNFLIDSESRLKSALDGMGHQH